MKLFFQEKGQGGLEIMIIATAVIIMGILFSSIYLSSQDSTTALIIAKNRLTEKLNLLEEPAIIETIRYSLSGQNTIDIKIITIPKSISLEDIPDGVQSITDEITEKTGFENAVILLNPQP